MSVAQSARPNRGTKIKSVERFNQEIEVQGHLCEIAVTGDFNHVKGTFKITTHLSATHATYDDTELDAILDRQAVGVANAFKWAMKLKRQHDNGKNNIADNQGALSFPGQGIGEPEGEFVKVVEAG